MAALGRRASLGPSLAAALAKCAGGQTFPAVWSSARPSALGQRAHASSEAATAASEDGGQAIAGGQQTSSSADSAPVASPGPSSQRLLLRDFIQQSLYHPTRGYFQRDTPVVGNLGEPMNFWQVYCKEEWNIMVKKRYEELQVSFLTPVELFTPWYGYILARHMLEHRKHNLKAADDLPLVIYEIGGGNGTLARDILDWLRRERPDVYEVTTYTCMEISTKLAARQYETVVSEAGHHSRFHMMRGNAWDRSTWGPREWPHCFILAMEVLDNLPHDRVVRSSSSQPWLQTVVVPAEGAPSMEDGPWEEMTEPVADSLLERALASAYVPPTFEDRLDKQFNKLVDFILAREPPASESPGDADTLFVPSGSLALLDSLHAARPNHSLIFSDFAKLPDVTVPGVNAPLIAEKIDGKNIDHDTIYVPWGTADIFFPTDFDALARMYRASAEHAWGKGVGTVLTEHYHQGAVMKRYKEMKHTATISAFNPMVDDFLNARFFFGDSCGRVGGGAGVDASVGSVGGEAAPPPPGSKAAAGEGEGEGTDSVGGAAKQPERAGSGSSSGGAGGPDGGGGAFTIGASTTSISQPRDAAAAAAVTAAAARRQRAQAQAAAAGGAQQAPAPPDVQPDAAGLPVWAQLRLRQRQAESATKRAQEAAADAADAAADAERAQGTEGGGKQPGR